MAGALLQDRSQSTQIISGDHSDKFYGAYAEDISASGSPLQPKILGLSIMPVKALFSWADSVYHFYLSNSDPRVLAWPMVDNDALNFLIVGCYAFFVIFLGPKIMKNRKPFDLRRLMVPYNIALIVVNLYIFVQYSKIRWFGPADTGCVPLRISNSPEAFRLAEITWWFYITKYVELSDTVFFVLRKKENQLSNLHLIHHTSVPLIVWALLRFEPGGYNTFFPQANSFVHCVMYTYYAMSAFGEDVREHLWFKKYVTMTQMIQFIVVLTYFLTRPFVGCKISNMAFGFNVFIAGFFFVLFCNFYYHAYMKEEPAFISKERAEPYIVNGNAPKKVE